MTVSSFSEHVLGIGNNEENVCTAQQVMSSAEEIPPPLREPITNEALEDWFRVEATKRISDLPPAISGDDRKDALEKDNRYEDGTMELAEQDDLLQMSELCESVDRIRERAEEGRELLANNKQDPVLGTAARGVPCGGASSRANTWINEHPVEAARFGLGKGTPRPLFKVGPRTLLHHTLAFSRHVARKVGRVFPNILMINSEVAPQFTRSIREDWRGFTPDELDSTLLFNQIVLPRIWVEDLKKVTDPESDEVKLFPAGHGDFPFLLAEYGLVKALADQGIRYLFFSNADEWQWQPDPVMISIADELFAKGHHMVIIGTENINNQCGGAFVKMTDGCQSLVETPRLPWSFVEQRKAPLLLNTTFYVIDVQHLAQKEGELKNVKKSLVVKNRYRRVPGSEDDIEQQILGVDSWAGDVFSQLLNPAFIQWPRLNFLGIKDGGFITGREPVRDLGGRSYLHYVSESVATFPVTMSRLLDGDKKVAKELFESGYSYLLD